MSEAASRPEIASISSTSISLRDQIKADIDEIIASECIYCGDGMLKYVKLIDFFELILFKNSIYNSLIFQIRLIDVPFIPDDDYDRTQKEWE